MRASFTDVTIANANPLAAIAVCIPVSFGIITHPRSADQANDRGNRKKEKEREKKNGG